MIKIYNIHYSQPHRTTQFALDTNINALDAGSSKRSINLAHLLHTRLSMLCKPKHFRNFIQIYMYCRCYQHQQENPRDVFRDHSRSPNIVPFHMLGIVSY